MGNLLSGIRDWLTNTASTGQLVILYGGAFLAIATALCQAGKATCNRLWPSRPKHEWIAQCTPLKTSDKLFGQPQADPNNAWQRKGRWTHGKTMEVGDWYHLFLDKPRILSRIEIYSEGLRFPKKVKFLYKESQSDNNWSEIQKSEPREIPAKSGDPNDNNIILLGQFSKPQRVEAIKLEIVEPRLEPKDNSDLPPAWAIYRMEFIECRLFGRWPKTKIE